MQMMIAILIGLVLIVVGLVALVLQRLYSSIPLKELKRLAKRGDHLAEALYKPVAHGASLRLLLWTVFCVNVSAGLLLVAYNVPLVLAFVILAVSIAAAVIVQSLRLTVRGAHFAVKVAPAITWVLGYAHAPLDLMVRLINRFRSHSPHSGLYEKEDVLDLLAQQKDQPDNRIAESDLELLIRAIEFDDRQAADVVLPMSRVKLIKADDDIGPVLLGELHASGQDSFLVYEGTPDHVIGTLFLRDAVAAKSGGKVKQLIHPRMSFVHEDFTLRQVLRALIRTGQFMVVVVNTFEEPVGVITLSHLLQQLVGEHKEGDFDDFENKTAVAAYKPVVLEPVTEDAPSEEPTPSPEATEVVESER